MVKHTEVPSTSLPTLLLLTDFSEASEQAFQWAIPEAKQHHWRISVLYPYRLDPSRKHEYAVKSKKDMEREACVTFEKQLEETLRLSKIPYEFHAEVGFIRDRITEHTRKRNIVLLVLGQKLASSESLHELLEDVNIPIVIVPHLK